MSGTETEHIREEAELRWPVTVAILVALVLYAGLPSVLPPTIRYCVIGVCVLLLIPVVVVNPRRLENEVPWARRLSIIAASILLVANLVAFVDLVFLLISSKAPDPQGILLGALEVWVTMIITFAVLYWELDRGGPVIRHKRPRSKQPEADFRFPQDDNVEIEKPPWRPQFFDYLYLSSTNSMAFSPTDTLPMTHRAKALMLVQSVAGFLLLALAIARAVNVLG